MLRAFAHRHADRLGGVILGSVGQLGAAWELPFGAGTGVPVMNRRAAALLFGAGCRFVTASLTVCIGAMAIVGAIQDGILGDYSTLAVKAVLDFIIVAVMTSSLGKGSAFGA